MYKLYVSIYVNNIYVKNKRTEKYYLYKHMYIQEDAWDGAGAGGEIGISVF